MNDTDEDQDEAPELRFIRHALRLLDIPFEESDWLHGKTWRKDRITLTWGLRSIMDPPSILHPALPATQSLPRELDERLAAYLAAIAQATDLSFRDRVLLTAIVNFKSDPP